MTVVTLQSVNMWSVANDAGIVIGVIMLSPNGFVAMAGGQQLGTFGTMSAAIAAITTAPTS